MASNSINNNNVQRKKIMTLAQALGWLTQRAPDGWESPRFWADCVAEGWFRQSGVASSHPPAGNAIRWALRKKHIMDTQSMNLSKKNALSIFGWLAFIAFFESVVFLLKSWSVNSRSYLVSLNWHPFVYLVIIGVIVFGVNFLAYVLSWRLVVFPIARRGGVNYACLKYPLFLDWLTFCFAIFLLFLPVAFLIQFLPALLPLSENTVKVITAIWQALVSLWLYRDRVLSYLSESSDPVKNAESQSAVPS